METNLFIIWPKVRTLLLSLAFYDFYENKNWFNDILSQQRSIPAEKKMQQDYIIQCGQLQTDKQQLQIGNRNEAHIQAALNMIPSRVSSA